MLPVCQEVFLESCKRVLGELSSDLRTCIGAWWAATWEKAPVPLHSVRAADRMLAELKGLTAPQLRFLFDQCSARGIRFPRWTWVEDDYRPSGGDRMAQEVIERNKAWRARHER